MRTVAILCVSLSLICGAAMGQGLDARKITLVAGDGTTLNAPVCLPYDGPMPTGDITVTEEGTARSFPATVRNGQFVFVPEGAMPKTTHTYQVKVEPGSMPPKVLVKKNGDTKLDVLIEDKPFTTYHFAPDQKKPYLWPVLSATGVGLTRDWPMGAKEETGDHKHHTSFWSAYGNVNGANCWTEEEGTGFQTTVEVTSGSGNAYGWIHAKNVWQDKEHKPVLREEREYRFYAGPADARLVDVDVTFTASDGEVLFKDTKEGGIVSLRMRDALREKGGTGVITNSAGGKGMAECWGKPAAWCDYSGKLPDAGALGIAVFDSPSNLRYPTSWHVRDYGLFGASCFGLSDFAGEKPNTGKGDYTLEAGKSLTFHYRVLVHSGDAATAKVADRYADYATPPKAAWANAGK